MVHGTVQCMRLLVLVSFTTNTLLCGILHALWGTGLPLFLRMSISTFEYLSEGLATILYCMRYVHISN